MSDRIYLKCLEFLYEQVQANKIPQLKKGMVEDLVELITKILANEELERIGKRMSENESIESVDLIEEVAVNE